MLIVILTLIATRGGAAELVLDRVVISGDVVGALAFVSLTREFAPAPESGPVTFIQAAAPGVHVDELLADGVDRRVVSRIVPGVIAGE